MCNDLSVNMYYYAVTPMLPKNVKSMFLLCIKNINSYKQLQAYREVTLRCRCLSFVHVKTRIIQGKVFRFRLLK